jgi:hypothetical protein
MNEIERPLKKTKQAKIMKLRLFRYLRLFSLLLFIAISTIPAIAQTTNFDDVSVKIESITSGSAGVGYDEYRATIINRSPNKPRQVTLITPSSPVRNIGNAISELKRTVEVAPSSTAKVSLFLPPLELSGIDFSVVIDGKRQTEAVSIDAARTGAWVRRVNNKLFLLVSQSVSKSGLMNESAVEEGLKDTSGNVDVAYLPYEFPLSEWSTNWLGYTRFDGVVITADDLRAMPEGVLSALWRYLECGGSLLVIGFWEAPQQWRMRLELIGAIETEVEAGTETQPEPQSPVRVTPSKNGLQTYYIGFGTLNVTGAVDPKQITPSQWRGIKLNWEGSRPDENYYVSISDINREFTVVDRIGVPVRGLFALMILFVIVIGPINLLWLARRGKKIWLLWTVPAISFMTCLAVSTFAFFGEGLSATARTESMVILDETSHRATTIGWMAFYSPVTPGEGLHFSTETELMPRLPQAWGYGRGGGLGRTIDWSGDQHFAFGWITARVPVFFKFRKSETRRERLTVRQAGNDSISIVNGLGADIRQLWWADDEGEIYTATNIPAGAESDLTMVNLKAEGNAHTLRDVFKESDWLGKFNTIAVNPRQSLTANCYLALMDSAPFVEEGLRRVKSRKAKTLVYGIR